MSSLIKGNTGRILFVLHLFAYLAVIGLITIIWAVTGLGYFWPLHVIFGWGFGIGFHAITYLLYNDKVAYLTKIKEQSDFGILYIYHAFFFISVNIYLMILNLSIIPIQIWFTWPLLIWGVAFIFHTIGFFTWEKYFEKEMAKIRGKYDYSEKRLKRMANSKLTQFWFLIIHLALFIVVAILIYTITLPINLQNQIENSITWGIIVGLHVLSYYLFNFVETQKPVMLGLIFHIIAYTAINIWLIIYNLIHFAEITIFLATYPLVLWAIAIVIHAFLTYKWDSILPKAIEHAKSISREELEDFEIHSKAVELIFWQWSWIAHIFIYIVGIIFIGINFTSLGLDPTLIVHPIMGWLIGVAVHGVLFFIVQRPITGFLLQTLVLHTVVYIVTSIYLVLLNLIYSPNFLWSAIAIGGWGIGWGFHVMLWYLTKK